MTNLQALIIALVASAFGALITYFFKTVYQGKSVEKEMKTVIDNGFKTHEQIHHKSSQTQLIDIAKQDTKEKLDDYKKEVDYKFSEQEKKTEKSLGDVENIKQSLNSININIAGIYGALKIEPGNLIDGSKRTNN